MPYQETGWICFSIFTSQSCSSEQGAGGEAGVGHTVDLRNLEELVSNLIEASVASSTRRVYV